MKFNTTIVVVNNEELSGATRTEINPTEEQKAKICKTIGTCRYIYNFYLAHNKELYNKGEKFMSSNQFRVWLNNEYISKHPECFGLRKLIQKQ